MRASGVLLFRGEMTASRLPPQGEICVWRGEMESRGEIALARGIFGPCESVAPGKKLHVGH